MAAKTKNIIFLQNSDWKNKETYSYSTYIFQITECFVETSLNRY